MIWRVKYRSIGLQMINYMEAIDTLTQFLL